MTEAKKEYVYDVFISHSVKDKIKADAICHILEEKGIRCFYAPRDIPSGSKWDAEIVKGINESKIFLLVFGENALNSKYVKKELALAVGDEHKVIPFKIDDTMPEGAFAFHLADINWIDGTAEPFKERINDLARTLLHILKYPDPSILDDPIPKPIPIKKILIGCAIILCILLVGIVSISMITNYSDGTIEHPFKISTPDELDAIRDNLNANYVLTSDIDLRDYYNWRPIGTDRFAPFTGSLDGAGHTISNLKINTKYEHAGLFGYGDGCTLQNIKLKNIDISGEDSVGGLIGYLNNYAEVNKCVIISGNVAGKGHVGGLIGSSDASSNTKGNNIVNCGVEDGVKIDGSVCTGGLIGDQDYGTIKNCWSHARYVKGYAYVGGLVGSLNCGSVYNSYADCEVEASDSGAGGLVGMCSSEALIKYCYATGGPVGTVKGYSSVGGLIGVVMSGSNTVSSCLSTENKITASKDTTIHRVIGSKSGSVNIEASVNIENCYAYNGMTLNGMAVESGGGTYTLDGACVLKTQYKGEKSFYESTLGFDMNTVWKEAVDGQYPPILRVEEEI